MRKDLTVKVLLALALPMLGGCQSLFHAKSAKIAVRPAEAPDYSEGGATEAIEQGRKALDEGRHAAALDAFRYARLSSGHAAAAYNGMAIAYSRLGRQDLAERYFMDAIAIAPRDRRYQANLAHFYQINPVKAFAQDSEPRRPVRSQRPMLTQSEQATKAETHGLRPGAPVRVQDPKVRFVQASANEVRIASGHGTGIAVSEKARVGKSPIRVSMLGGDVAGSQPVKVSLASEPIATGRRSASTQGGYPIRVSFGALEQ